MFTEEDVKNAAQVEPLDDVTQVSAHILKGSMAEKRLPAMAPAAVIFTLILVTAPKGAVLETARSVVNYARQLWSEPKRQSELPSVNQGNTSVEINANNSNVQSVHVNNYGGQVSISPQK